MENIKIQPVSGYSTKVTLEYIGEFVLDVDADHWGTGTVQIERSRVGSEKYSILKDQSDNTITFSSNDSVIVPGYGDYRALCSNFNTMSGLEISFTRFK